MKIEYRATKGGVGVFINMDIELINECSSENIEMIEEKIYFAFSNDTPGFYNEGRFFIKKAILKYKDLIIDKSELPVFFCISNIEDNPAHYQVETFFGATILGLKKIFSLDIKEPDYYYDTVNRKFIFEGV